MRINYKHQLTKSIIGPKHDGWSLTKPKLYILISQIKENNKIQLTSTIPRFCWKVHFKKVFGSHFSLSKHNKIQLYKQTLKPVWAYGIQIWSCTSKSNILIIQRFQHKVLKNTVNEPWYIRNSNLHQMGTVYQTITRVATSHEQRCLQHVNVEAIQFLDNTNLTKTTTVINPRKHRYCLLKKIVKILNN